MEPPPSGLCAAFLPSIPVRIENLQSEPERYPLRLAFFQRFLHQNRDFCIARTCVPLVYLLPVPYRAWCVRSRTPPCLFRAWQLRPGRKLLHGAKSSFAISRWRSCFCHALPAAQQQGRGARMRCVASPQARQPCTHGHSPRPFPSLRERVRCSLTLPGRWSACARST